MEIRQKVGCRPVTMSGLDMDSSKAGRKVRTGRVVYIHPKSRYVMVEFEARGGTVRENFPMGEVWAV